MVNGVPREVPRPKPEGPQAPRVLAVGPPEALHSPKEGRGGTLDLRHGATLPSVVPREVPRPKPLGPAAPRVLALGPP